MKIDENYSFDDSFVNKFILKCIRKIIYIFLEIEKK